MFSLKCVFGEDIHGTQVLNLSFGRACRVRGIRKRFKHCSQRIPEAVLKEAAGVPLCAKVFSVFERKNNHFFVAPPVGQSLFG